MALDILCLTIFLILFVYRLILLRNIAALPRQRCNPFVQDLHILDWVDRVSSERSEREGRAECYLRRVTAITGATRTSKRCCFLNVGKSKFQVHDQYVERVRDVTDSDCRLEHTCFYLVNQHMPAAERIATVLLQLKNNPTLFDGWFARSAAFKANGDVFRLIEKPPYG